MPSNFILVGKSSFVATSASNALTRSLLLRALLGAPSNRRTERADSSSEKEEEKEAKRIMKRFGAPSDCGIEFGGGRDIELVKCQGLSIVGLDFRLSTLASAGRALLA